MQRGMGMIWCRYSTADSLLPGCVSAILLSVMGESASARRSEGGRMHELPASASPREISFVYWGLGVHERWRS